MMLSDTFNPRCQGHVIDWPGWPFGNRGSSSIRFFYLMMINPISLSKATTKASMSKAIIMTI